MAASEVIVYSLGLVRCSVCAPSEMGSEEVAAEVNSTTPTGVSSSWHLSSDPVFSTGHDNPCACEQYPDTRRHWLLEC